MLRWPDVAHSLNSRAVPDDASPFSVRRQTRALRLAVDMLGRSTRPACQLLEFFVSHPQIEVIDVGGEWGSSTELIEHDHGGAFVIRRDGTSTSAPMDTARLRQRAEVLHDTGGDTASSADERFHGLVRLRAAEAMTADVFVTNQTELHAETSRCVSLDEEAAVGLVGSFLRCAGDYRTGDADPNLPRLFDRILAHVMLPRRDEWRVLVDRQARPGDYSVENDLVDGVITRISQALRARDWMHWSLLADGDSDDTLMFLDTLLATLSAALDAAVLVIDRAVGLNTPNLRSIGWSSTSWRRRLPGDLRAILDEDASSADVSVLSGLRNTLHGPNLSAVGYSAEVGQASTLVVVPTLRHDSLATHLDDAGVASVPLADGELAYHPADIVEWLTPRVAQIIDRSLVATAAHCVWPPQQPPAPWHYDRWDVVQLLGGLQPLA